MEIRSTIKIYLTIYDTEADKNYIEDQFYREVIACLRPMNEVEIVSDIDDLDSSLFMFINFESNDDMKDFSQNILEQRQRIESNVGGIMFGISMTVNDINEDFSYNNRNLVYNSINALAVDQDKITQRLLAIEEFLRQQSRFNHFIVSDKDTVKNIMIGFDPKHDKWN